MVEWLRQPDGTMKTLIEGKKRARVTRYVFEEEFFKADAEEIEEAVGRSAELEGLVHSVVFAFAIYAQRGTRVPPEIANSTAAIDDPSILCDKMVRHLDIQLWQQQALLESVSPVERLEKIFRYLQVAVF
jgi:ATP-dependent Lon protease